MILIPGGFKPPTVGHFNMIQQYDRNPNVVKVFIVVGFKPREGVTHEQSMKIFDIYGGFSDKVEFKNADGYPTPMTACFEFMKDSEFTARFSNSVWSLGASDKEGDEDRIYQFEKYFNEDNPGVSDAKVIAVDAAEAYEVGGEAASASRMRKAVIDKNWEEFKSLLPNKNVYNDVLNVLNIDDEGGGSQERKLDENFLSLTSLSMLGNLRTPLEMAGIADAEPYIDGVVNTLISKVDAAEEIKKKEKEQVRIKQQNDIERAVQTDKPVAVGTEEETDLTLETSGMAGGSVEGGAVGSPWGKLKKRDYYV